MTGIGDALFTRTRQRVLALLYREPGRSFYTNEIVRWAAGGRGAVCRELERLAAAGLLTTFPEGNQVRYQANADSPVHGELLRIVRKTFGVADVVRTALHAVEGQVALAFIYGSVAKGEDGAGSDIDLLVVSDSLAYSKLMELLATADEQLARPVNPTLYNREQLAARLRKPSAFLAKVLTQPKIWIKGTPDDLSAIGQSGQDWPTQAGAPQPARV